MTELRLCNCGNKAEIRAEYYPNTKYKMYKVCCTNCFIKTNACRRLSDAVKEWNNPMAAKLN